MADVGGIDSLLPLLENIKVLISLESSRSLLRLPQSEPSAEARSERSALLVNNFLQLAI